MTTPKQLAKAARVWRGSIPVRVAAAQLGIPKKTWDNIEQERGFPYPQLLLTVFKITTCKAD